MKFALTALHALIERLLNLADGDRCINRPDVHHRLPLPAMKVRHTGHRLSTVEPENEGEILEESRLRHLIAFPIPKSGTLPILTLVLAEVQHLKRLAAFYS